MSGPPPLPASRPSPPRRQDSIDAAIPDEAPPAYSEVGASGDALIDHGPSRMDFSGPPPLPDRLTQTPTGGMVLPGVGVGYGRVGSDPSTPISPISTGYAAPSAPPPSHGGPINSHGTGYASPSGPPPPPPQHNRHSAPPPPLRVEEEDDDPTPTEAPVPGRPLLRNGQLLVYPKGHHCSKCQNTGYKNYDPNNPCSSDWRKYGKPYNGALAVSFKQHFKPGGNGATTASSNFQKPLPKHRPAGPSSAPPQRPASSFIPPPPGLAAAQGYHNGFQPGFQQQPQWGMPMRPPAPIHTYGRPPSGAVVMQAGDPRLGGRLCWRCNGAGREAGFFLFDDQTCSQCRGIGRVF
ncbi:Proline/serine-rich protein [Vanrija pseudolonga]|uniref:Proline/serine-rich protein n=1 Tax=Vanrija pseudolonga TaxID=143232 RepID=A0AAF0YBS3_9TREE|nr:Proline/serine-rich protein [Vanrija pseudolonga]